MEWAEMDQKLLDLYANKALLVFTHGIDWFNQQAYSIIDQYKQQHNPNSNVPLTWELGLWELDNGYRE